MYKRLNPLQYADAIRRALRHNAVASHDTKRVVTNDDEAIARLVAETTDKSTRDLRRDPKHRLLRARVYRNTHAACQPQKTACRSGRKATPGTHCYGRGETQKIPSGFHISRNEAR